MAWQGELGCEGVLSALQEDCALDGDKGVDFPTAPPAAVAPPAADDKGAVAAVVIGLLPLFPPSSAGDSAVVPP